ncbi:MAG: hypothetical protein JWL69_1394, partial [Phycisphaerales bacterium]|nr:hypothetical protein [Phycisphaerales bacterium]
MKRATFILALSMFGLFTSGCA